MKIHKILKAKLLEILLRNNNFWSEQIYFSTWPSCVLVFFWFVCSVFGVIRLISWVFLKVLICQMFQALFLGVVAVLNFSTALLLSLPADLNCCHARILTGGAFL